MKRVHLIANVKSGKGHGAEIPDLTRKVCRELGAEFFNYDIESPKELLAKTREAIRAASPGDIVMAAGGDGTLRTVAEELSQKEVAAKNLNYAVVATGTFNFFARTHGIPDDHEAAIRLALTGRPKKIRLGEINGRVFLINASMGLYAKSIEEREKSTAVFGRHQIVVLVSTAFTLLKPHRLLSTVLKIGGKAIHRKTPMIFIGNNALQFRNLEMTAKKCFLEDRLGVVILKPVRGFEMVRVLARGALRTIENEERVEQFCVDELDIETKRRNQNVALDGEMFKMTSPFTVLSKKEAISLIVPAEVHGDRSL